MKLHFLKRCLVTIALLASIGTHAAVDLITAYSLDPAQPNRTLLNTPNINVLKGTTYLKVFTRYEAIGWTENQVMAMTQFVGAWEDVIWRTSGLPFVTAGVPNISDSRETINVGYGAWGVNYPCTIAFGKYNFSNKHPYYALNPGSTEIDLLHSTWIDDPAMVLQIADLGAQTNIIRAAFRSTTFGKEATTAGYHEIFQFDPPFIDGKQAGYVTQGYLYCGIVVWDMGSNAVLKFSRTHNCDVGVMCIRGTPGIIEGGNFFNNGYAAMLGVGNALNDLQVDLLESDDAPYILRLIPGFGREAGGRWNIGTIKGECGVTSESRGPWAGQAVIYAQGQFTVTIDNIGYSASQVHTDAIFIVDPRLSDGSYQASLLDVRAVTGFGYNYLIQDVANGFVIPTPGDYQGTSMHYHSRLFGTVTGDLIGTKRDRAWFMAQPGAPNPFPPTVCGARLGFQRWNGSAFAPPLDHVANTPLYSYFSLQGVPTQTVTTVNVTLGSSSTTSSSTVQATAVILDQNGNQMNGTIVWSIQPGGTGTATVTSSGLVTAGNVGTAFVRATVGTVFGQQTLTITSPANVLAKFLFSNSAANAATLVANPGTNLQAAGTAYRAQITNGLLTVINIQARYPFPGGLSGVRRITLTNFTVNAATGYLFSNIYLQNGRWLLNNITDIGAAPAVGVFTATHTITIPSGTILYNFLDKNSSQPALLSTMASMTFYDAP